jgi:type I restriction enzyme S subunit
MQADPLQGAKLLSYRFTSNMDELALHKRMILVTCSGTIGNSVYVNDNFRGAVGSPDLLRIVADPAQIPPGYLYAFLSSSLGRALIEQKTYGAVVPHIEAHHVMDLPIPRVEPDAEQRIHELIERGAALRVEANRRLIEAQETLLRQNCLPRMTNREALTKGCWCFTVPRSQCGRFALTAWTYNPVTRAAIARIQAGQHARLDSLVQDGGIYYGHRFARRDSEPSVGIRLLSQGNVFEERPRGRWISKRCVQDYREYMVPNGAILVAAQGTTGDSEVFGHCQFSHRNYEDCMITEHILRIIPDSRLVNPAYLFDLLFLCQSTVSICFVVVQEAQNYWVSSWH